MAKEQIETVADLDVSNPKHYLPTWLVYSRKWNNVYEVVQWGRGWKIISGNYPNCFTTHRCSKTFIVLGKVLD